MDQEMRSILLAVVFLGVALMSCSVSRDRESDEILKPYRLTDGPGGAVIVLRRDSVLYTKVFGRADVEAGTEITLATNFRLASVTKQFTAMAVMILVERGRVSLGQNLTDFFPDFAPVGRKITLKHLLTHTSGIAAYEDVMPESTTVPLLDRDVLQLLKNMDSTYSLPGSTFRYSNSGYALLALVIEKVSGISFARFLRDNIFLPLGMSNTVAYERGISEVPHRAFGYSVDTGTAGRFVCTDQSLTSSVLGDGGIYSSINDLRKWAAALTTGSLVSERTLQEMFSRSAIVETGKSWYGFGWYSGSMDGVPVHYHGGSTVGFRTCIVRIPDRFLTVIGLFNRSDVNSEEFCMKLARLHF
jgi:CubicO group peptidase (beta-lactamase class C family)